MAESKIQCGVITRSLGHLSPHDYASLRLQEIGNVAPQRGVNVILTGAAAGSDIFTIQTANAAKKYGSPSSAKD